MKDTIKLLIPDKYRPLLTTLNVRMKYFGFRYKCPICNCHLKQFLPAGLKSAVLHEKKIVGGGYRHNALCPICGSLDRERLLYVYLKQRTNIFSIPQKLLHFAPEERVSEKLMSLKSLNYLSADLHSKYAMVKMDITDIQYPDGSFNAIICNHVLEHIIDDHKAMCELYRVLKPGGWAILQVPISLSLSKTFEDNSIISAKDREEHYGQKDHVRIYSMDYKERLEQVGFRVVVFEWVTDYDNFGGCRNRYGLIEDERVFIANKDY